MQIWNRLYCLQYRNPFNITRSEVNVVFLLDVKIHIAYDMHKEWHTLLGTLKQIEVKNICGETEHLLICLSVALRNCNEQLRIHFREKKTAHNPSHCSDALSRDYLISCPA